MIEKRIAAAIVTALSICLGSAASLADGSRQTAEIIVPADSKQLYESWGFAPAVKIDDVIYVSGVIVVLEGDGSYEERYANGFRSALEQIEGVLSEAGADLDDVIEITTFHTDLQRQLQTAVAIRMQEMKPPHPAWTAVGTTALAIAEGVTEIKVIAHVGD